jgi:hypothetical protein
VIRAGALALLFIALGAVGVVVLTSDGNEPRTRAIRAVALPTPPAADVLEKAATQAELTGGEIGELLERVRSSPQLDVRLPELRRGDVVLRDVVIHKDGPAARAEATVSEKEIAEYLPGGVELHYDPDAGGEGIVFSGKGSVLGVSVPVKARASAENGDVVVVPEGLPIGRMTLFSDPNLRIDALSARPAPGGLRVRIEGTFAG